MEYSGQVGKLYTPVRPDLDSVPSRNEIEAYGNTLSMRSGTTIMLRLFVRLLTACWRYEKRGNDNVTTYRRELLANFQDVVR